MKLRGTKKGTPDNGRDPGITDLRKSVRRLRVITASLFALMIVLNLTPAAAEIKAKITGEDVVDESLTGADIKNRGLTGDDVAGGSIDGFNIALDTLVGGHVVDDSLTTLDIQDGTLTGADVQDGSLTGADVAPSSLNGSHVGNNTLTGSDIDESTLNINTGVSGYQIVVDRDLLVGPNEVVRVSAECPGGKLAVGGGYEVEAGSFTEPEGALVTEAGPTLFVPAPGAGFLADGWTARMVNGGIFTVDLSVYAICVFARTGP